MNPAAHEIVPMTRVPGATAASSPWRAAGVALTIASVVLIAATTLGPGDASSAGLSWCVICGEVGGTDAILNVALFVPLGIGLALSGVRPWTAMAAIVGLTVAIEGLQVGVVPDRDASFGDLVMNAGGGAIGIWIGAQLTNLLWPPARLARWLVISSAAAWLGIQAIAAFTLVPSQSAPPHRLATGRGLGPQHQAFPGQITRVEVDGVVYFPRPFPRGRTFHEMEFREGATVRASAIPRTCATKVAAIVLAGDALFHQVLELSLRGGDLVFGVKTGADALRLRPIRYRLSRVLQSSANCSLGGDTLFIESRYERDAVLLRAHSRGGLARELQVAPRISQSWMLLSPIPWYREPGLLSRLADAVWLAALILPVAYWSAFLRIREHGVAWVNVAVPLVAIGVAFVALPILFGLRLPAPDEWLAAIAGAALGVAGGTVARRKK